MKVKDMTDAQVRKEAKAHGIPTRGVDVDALRKAVVAARKAVKASEGKVVANMDPWPPEWSQPQREAYYQRIVRNTLPSDAGKAWEAFTKAIDDQSDILASQINDAPVPDSGNPDDCFGLGYSEVLEVCNKNCPQMPLCKEICRKRPELRARVDAAAKALDDAEQMSVIEKKEALALAVPTQVAVSEKKKAKKGKAKKVVVRYVWNPEINVKSYKNIENMDEDLYKVYRWMTKQEEGFTKVELIAKMEKYFDDVEESAAEQLEFLLADDAIVRQT